jgi:hypothetical protein
MRCELEMVGRVPHHTDPIQTPCDMRHASLARDRCFFWFLICRPLGGGLQRRLRGSPGEEAGIKTPWPVLQPRRRRGLVLPQWQRRRTGATGMTGVAAMGVAARPG